MGLIFLLGKILDTSFHQVRQRESSLPALEVLHVDWEDSLSQKLDPGLLKELAETIIKTLVGGLSVLIHCAQVIVPPDVQFVQRVQKYCAKNKSTVHVLAAELCAVLKFLAVRDLRFWPHLQYSKFSRAHIFFIK